MMSVNWPPALPHGRTLFLLAMWSPLFNATHSLILWIHEGNTDCQGVE